MNIPASLQQKIDYYNQQNWYFGREMLAALENVDVEKLESCLLRTLKYANRNSSYIDIETHRNNTRTIQLIEIVVRDSNKFENAPDSVPYGESIGNNVLFSYGTVAGTSDKPFSVGQIEEFIKLNKGIKEKMNILLFKEWKENPNYKIDKWFIDRKIQIEKWFVEELPDFEIDYFEWSDPNSFSEMFTGSLYFNEAEIQYRLDFILDSDKVEASDINDFSLQMTGYRKSDGETLGSIDKAASLDQLVPNLIIELVNDFKTTNIDSEGNRIISNELPGPEGEPEDTEENTDEQPAQPTTEEEPTGEVQEEPEAQPAPEDTEDEEIQPQN